MDEWAAITWAGLPPDARRAAETLVVDALGIASVGRTAPGVGAALDAWEHDMGRGAVRLPFTCASLPAPAAAAALSALIHAWDFDDTHDSAVVHTACVALPAALAAGAAGPNTAADPTAQAAGAGIDTPAGCSGADVMAGFVTGVQVLARVSAAVGGQRGMIRTAALGSLGAAAAAARTLKLPPDRFTAALGLALATTGSAMTRQVVAEGAPAKRLQPAFAVQAGVSAALLAARGAPGPTGWLDGEYGVLRLRPDGDLDAARAEIHAPGWEVTRLSLKPYPACRYTHAAIAAVLGAPADGLDKAVVRVPEGPAYEMVARPFAWRGQPVADVQFSIPWLVAAALLTGTVELGTLRPGVLDDPEIELLAARVAVHQDLPAQYGMAPAEVELTYADGRVEHRRADMPGSPENPLTLDQVRTKAASCARLAGRDDVTADRISRFATGLAGLSAADLAAALTGIDTQEV